MNAEPMNKDQLDKWKEWLYNKIDLRRSLDKLSRTDQAGITWDSYEDYVLYGDTFARLEIDGMQIR